MIGTIKKNLTIYGGKCIKVEGGKITLVKIVRNESLSPLCRDTSTTKNWMVKNSCYEGAG